MKYVLDTQLVVWGSNVTLMSMGDGAVLDTQQQCSHFRVGAGAQLEVHGLQLVNGTGQWGGLALIKSTSTTASATFTGCVISNCEALGTSETVGAGLVMIVSSASATFTNCAISNCHAFSSWNGASGGLMAAISSASATFTGCVISNCNASSTSSNAFGGMAHLDGNASATFTGCEISGCTALSESWSALGGLAHIYTSASATFTDCVISSCAAISKSFYAAGGLACLRSFASATFTGCVMRNCSATTASVSDSTGGAIAIQSGNLALDSCTIKESTADEGGGLFIAGGQVTLTRTLVAHNDALLGKNVQIIGGSLTYRLPLVAGHWLPNSRCLISRESCFTLTDCAENLFSPACLQCQADRPNCTTQLNGTGCRPAEFVQPCNWDETKGGDPSLLGQQFYVAPNLPIDSIFPTPCPAGFLGSNESQHQASPACQGRCPAGSFCPTPATTQPEPCGIGHYCPRGSSAALPCPSGRFTSTTGTASLDECTACPAGSDCAIGSSQPRPCVPGSYSGASASECAQCDKGEYQGHANATACDACVPGAYCPAGAITPLPCPDGTHANTSLAVMTSVEQCVVCPEGTFCPVGSDTATPCAKGTANPLRNANECGACPAGSYQDETGQLGCKTCPSGHFCLQGASAPLPCPGGTFSRELRLASATGCLPVPIGYWAPTGSTEGIACPSSGFFCPGAADAAAHAAANITPAGSQPIPLTVGSFASQQRFTVEMPSVQIALTIDADLGTAGFDNATLTSKLAQLYGVDEELVKIVEMHGGSIVLLVRVAQESNTTLTEAVGSVDDAGLSAALGANTTADVVAFALANVTRSKIEQTSCKPGYWCTAGRVIACVVGFYNPEYDADDATACRSCPPQASTPGEASTSLEQCRCEPGYFDSNTTVGGITCTACLDEGVNCSMAGATLERLPLEEEYWRSHELSLQVRQCFEEGACLGGEVVSEYCAPGRRGPYCDVCKGGYDKSSDGSCYDCADGVSGASIVSMAVLGAVLLLVVCALLLLRRRRALAAAGTGASVSIASGGDVQEMVETWLQARFKWLAGLGVKVKILLSLYQVITTLGVVYDMPRLPIFDGLMDRFNLISLDFVKLTPLGCTFSINFHVSLVMRTAIPLGIVLLLSGLHVLSERRARRLATVAEQRSSDHSTKAHASARFLSWLGDNGVTFSFFLIFLIYPSTSSAILSFLQCFPIDGGSEYLRLDFSIDCNGDAHKIMTYYALLMIVVYPLGVPILYWAMFRVYQAELDTLRSAEILRAKLGQAAEAEDVHHHQEEVRREHQDEVKQHHQQEGGRSRSRFREASRLLKHSTRPKSERHLWLEARLALLKDEEEKGTAALPGYMKKLISGYELRCYHFEIFESLRKLALVGVPVFFTPAGGVAQLTFALLVCFVTFGMYTALSPYMDDGEDRLAQLCQAQIFFTLVASIVLKFDTSQVGSIDAVLSALTFLPLSVALILESPLPSCLSVKKMAGAFASANGAWRRLGAYLRSARRWPPRQGGAAERAADAAAVDALQSTDLPSALPLPGPPPLARGAPGADERPVAGRFAVEPATMLMAAGALGVETVSPPAEPPVTSPAEGPSTQSTPLPVSLGELAGEPETAPAGVLGVELGSPTTQLPLKEPTGGPPSRRVAAVHDPASSAVGDAAEAPSPLGRMSRAVFGFLADLGGSSQKMVLREDSPAHDESTCAPQQALASTLAQLLESEEALLTLAHGEQICALLRSAAQLADDSDASLKPGPSELASGSPRPSAPRADRAGSVRV